MYVCLAVRLTNQARIVVVGHNDSVWRKIIAQQIKSTSGITGWWFLRAFIDETV